MDQGEEAARRQRGLRPRFDWRAELAQEAQEAGGRAGVARAQRAADPGEFVVVSSS